jgi:hypothetical protein
VQSWNPLPGPAAATGKVRPGMVVLKVGDEWVSDMLSSGLAIENCVERVRRARLPVTMVLRAMDVYALWRAWNPPSPR